LQRCVTLGVGNPPTVFREVSKAPIDLGNFGKIVSKFSNREVIPKPNSLQKPQRDALTSAEAVIQPRWLLVWLLGAGCVVPSWHAGQTSDSREEWGADG
jgi:hypothetical protein